MDITFALLRRIFEFKHGYMTGEVQKIVIDLSLFPNAKIEDVYNYISKDPLLRIFWDNNNFYLAKFES